MWGRARKRAGELAALNRPIVLDDVVLVALQNQSAELAALRS